MAKFKKKAQVKQEIPTSSMPDVVFILLFFFMITTEMRETTIEVRQQIPRATQLRKLMKKGLVANLYIGEPNKTAQYGKEPKIQADDVFIDTKDIVRWVNEKKSELEEYEREQITIALKVDKEAKRGLISDVETELRKANARKLLYSTLEDTKLNQN